MSMSSRPGGGLASEDPMRSDSRIAGMSALDMSSSFMGNGLDVTIKDGVTQILEENP